MYWVSWLLRRAHVRECVGYFERPMCVSVCPIDCMIVDPNHKEGLDTLAEKFFVVLMETINSRQEILAYWNKNSAQWALFLFLR